MTFDSVSGIIGTAQMNCLTVIADCSTIKNHRTVKTLHFHCTLPFTQCESIDVGESQVVKWLLGGAGGVVGRDAAYGGERNGRAENEFLHLHLVSRISESCLLVFSTWSAPIAVELSNDN